MEQKDTDFKPGMVVKCSTGEDEIFGVIRRFTKLCIVLSIFNESWQYVLTSRPLNLWSITEVPGFTDHDGLVLHEMQENSRESQVPLPVIGKITDAKVLVSIACLEYGPGSLVALKKLVSEQDLLAVLCNASQDDVRSATIMQIKEPTTILAWLATLQKPPCVNRRDRDERAEQCWEARHKGFARLAELSATDQVYMYLIRTAISVELAIETVAHLTALESVEALCQDQKLNTQLQPIVLARAVQMGTTSAEILECAAMGAEWEYATVAVQRLHTAEALRRVLTTRGTEDYSKGVGAFVLALRDRLRMLTDGSYDHEWFVGEALRFKCDGNCVEALLADIRNHETVIRIATSSPRRLHDWVNSSPGGSWSCGALVRIGEDGKRAIERFLPRAAENADPKEGDDLTIMRIKWVCYGVTNTRLLIRLANRHPEYATIFLERRKNILDRRRTERRTKSSQESSLNTTG